VTDRYKISILESRFDLLIEHFNKETLFGGFFLPLKGMLQELFDKKINNNILSILRIRLDFLYFDTLTTRVKWQQQNIVKTSS